MKKLVLLIIVVLLPVATWAQKVMIDGINYRLNSSNKTASVERYTYSGDIVIPSSVEYNGEKYDVTLIYGFDGCVDLTSITIPNSVIEISSNAFQNCTSLTSINIPNSVTRIGSDAFRNCTSLASATIGNGVTEISMSIFQGCTSLASISIPNSVTSIGRNAFEGCTSLVSFNIPDSVTYIGRSAFLGCSGLKSIHIPEHVKTIESATFSNCSGLESITVDSNNKTFDSRDNCNAIIQTSDNYLLRGCKKTIIPNTVTYIGYSAFDGCTELHSISIPESVTNIGDGAFSGCTLLASIDISNSVTSIGGSAFADCTGLTSITLPHSVTSIYGGAFSGCRLENIVAKNAETKFEQKFGYESLPFSQNTLNHAMLYIPKGTWSTAVYDGGWYNFINIREMASGTEELSNSQAYTLMNAKSFGYLIYDAVNDQVKLVSSFHDVDESVANSSWQLVNADGRSYLYNIGAKKYAMMKADGSIELSTTPIALNLKNDENGIVLGEGPAQWNFVLNDKMNVDNNLTGIAPLTDCQFESASSYFTIGGQQISQPRRGVTVVRSKNGGAKKVVVK